MGCNDFDSSIDRATERTSGDSFVVHRGADTNRHNNNRDIIVEERIDTKRGPKAARGELDVMATHVTMEGGK